MTGSWPGGGGRNLATGCTSSPRRRPPPAPHLPCAIRADRPRELAADAGRGHAAGVRAPRCPSSPDALASSEWGIRLAALPQLACRLAGDGRIGDALDLMNRVIDVISGSDPNPRAKWKNGYASRWRPFLRQVAVLERNLAERVRAWPGRTSTSRGT